MLAAVATAGAASAAAGAATQARGQCAQDAWLGPGRRHLDGNGHSGQGGGRRGGRRQRHGQQPCSAAAGHGYSRQTGGSRRRWAAVCLCGSWVRKRWTICALRLLQEYVKLQCVWIGHAQCVLQVRGSEGVSRIAAGVQAIDLSQERGLDAESASEDEAGGRQNQAANGDGGHAADVDLRPGEQQQLQEQQQQHSEEQQEAEDGQGWEVAASSRAAARRKQRKVCSCC